MTEIEVMNDMLFCTKLDCKNCSRESNAVDGNKCIFDLMKDARSVIKMQYDTIEVMKEELERLKKNNEQLQKIACRNYPVERLVTTVNKIIEASYEAADCGDYVGYLVNAVQEFIRLTKLDAVVAFSVCSDYPQIMKK